MSTDTFVVPGKPVGKARPRFASNGHAYTPQSTRAYEDLVSWCASKSGCQVRDGPVMVTITVYWPIPSSWSKKRHAEAMKGLVWPTGKPDLDNVIKAVLDGMNGICWRDDAQVVGIVSRKLYDDEPRVFVKVEDIDNGEAFSDRQPDART